MSKKTLDFHLRHQSEAIFHQQVANTKTGINSFLRACKKYKVNFQQAVFCLEHTGIYNEQLIEVLLDKNMQVWVEQSLRVKRSLGIQRGKTDKLDATRLSEYAYRFQDKCRLWQPARAAVKQLKDLVALRNRLLKARKMLKVPIKEMQASSCETHVPLINKLNGPILRQLDGKNKMSVLNAIRNKLVLRIFACVKANRKYKKIYTHQLV